MVTFHLHVNFGELVQERRNSSASAMELRLSYANPLISVFCPLQNILHGTCHKTT